MPVPHFNIKITQRSKGNSAVAGAAYQAGEKLFSEYDQKTKNYTCKKEVVYTEIMLPPNAPPEYADRATLWNSVEEIEKQWNSQLARRFVAALPREVTKNARIVLLSNSDSFSSWDRLSGFCQTLTKSGNDYRILELRDCGGELNRAMRAMVQLLETFPRIDVVMAVNEQAALGAMAALEEKGVLSSTLVYSVDGSPEAKALISEGLMTATSAQSPLRIGRMAAEVVYEILEGKPYLTNIVVPVNQITQEDILRYGTEGWQ